MQPKKAYANAHAFSNLTTDNIAASGQLKLSSITAEYVPNQLLLLFLRGAAAPTL